MDDFKVHTRRVVVFVTISKLLPKAYCIVENFSMGLKILGKTAKFNSTTIKINRTAKFSNPQN